jgi:hypothetical protein
MKSIAELRALLMAAQKLTGQSSQERRAPSPEAVPALQAVTLELTQFLARNAEDAEAHRLLSRAQECLLNYPAARSSFETSLKLSGQRLPKDLKHLSLLVECESRWEHFPLTPDELADLGRYLEHALSGDGCDHSVKFTRQWLARRSEDQHEEQLAALRDWGGNCDCEIDANVVQSGV